MVYNKTASIYRILQNWDVYKTYNYVDLLKNTDVQTDRCGPDPSLCDHTPPIS